MDHRHIRKSVISLFIIFLVFGAQLASASPLFDNLQTAAGADLSQHSDLPTYIGLLVKVVLELLGLVLAVTIVYGGVTWATAQGDGKQVQKAKDMIKNALIGLVIVFASFAITTFVIDNLSRAAGTP